MPFSAAFDFGDAAAWSFIVAAILYHFGIRRIWTGAAVALAALAGLVIEAVLIPLT